MYYSFGLLFEQELLGGMIYALVWRGVQWLSWLVKYASVLLAGVLVVAQLFSRSMTNFFSFLRIPLPPVKQIQKAIVVSPSHNEFPICKKKVVPIWMIPFNFQCNITLLLILLASLPIRYLSLCIFGKVE
jgi:hypothetical protein